MRTAPLLRLSAVILAGWLICPAVTADEPGGTDHPALESENGAWVEVDGKIRQQVTDPTGYCITCHREQDPRTAKGNASPAGGAHSHPVGKPYPADDAGYTPLRDLDPRLPLIDGAVACITCHDAAAPDRSFTIPDASGQLCIACHEQ